MRAVLVWARATLSRRWRATVVLAVLVGLAGGVALAGVAGARRTDTALARFLAHSQPFDVFLFSTNAALDFDAVARLPQVADAGHSAYALFTPSTPSGEPDTAALGSINPFVRISRTGLGVSSDIPYLVEGRLPDADQPLEVAVNEEVADRHRLDPGSILRLWAYDPDQIDNALSGSIEPAGPVFDFTVTGIVRLPFDLDPVPRDPEVVYTGRGAAYLGPAFWTQHGDEVAAFGGEEETLELRLHRGSDVESFEAAVRGLPGGDSVEIQLGSEGEKVVREAEQATDVEAVALLTFAALAGLVGLLVVGQGLSRQVQLETAEHPVLRALGMTRGQLVGAVVLRAVAVALPGALLAVLLAVVVSPMTPIGLARRAEIDPGFTVDGPVLLLGAALVALTVLGRAALAGWHPAGAGTGTTSGGPRRSRAVERLAAAGLPPSTVTGVAMALDVGGRGGQALLRTALAGSLAAIAVAVAALTFAASLDRLVDTPELHGWDWDVVVGNLNDIEDVEVSGRQRLASKPFVEGFTALTGAQQPLTIGGLDVDAAGVELMEGEVFSPLTEGRPPAGPGEVVLGGRTMERLGVEVGDQVEARFAGQDLSLVVVGRAVLHPAIQFSFTLDEGALLSLEELRRLSPDDPATHFLVRYAEGVDEADAFAALQADWGKTVLRAQPPVEVENLRRVAGLPGVGAGLITILAMGTLAHAIVTSVRRRRGDLAVLKAIGFRRRDVAATVSWQATTLMGLALVVGLPLGVAVGRWSWQVVADGLGAPAPVTPVLAVILIVLIALAGANLVAALPARSAARIRPALALRSE